MTDTIRLHWGVSLPVLAFSLLASTSAIAQTCTVPPTCESMGYNKTAAQCGNLATLKCPFDESKLFCTAFTDGEGNAIMAVGDILYSDGSFSTEPIANKKPIGVIFDISGMAVATKNALTDTAYNDGEYNSKYCSKYSDYDITGWKAPNTYQISAIYENKIIINATLAKIISASQIGGKMAYNNNADTSYMNFSDGKKSTASYSDSDWKLHCVLDRASLLTTPVTPTSTYNVGDAYKDSSGNIIGTVVAITNNGKNGTIAYAEGSGTSSDAAVKCSQKTTGGKAWTLASDTHTCTLLKTSGSVPGKCDDSMSNTITCGMHSADGRGACVSGKPCTKRNMGLWKSLGGSVDDVLTYVCTTTF